MLALPLGTNVFTNADDWYNGCNHVTLKQDWKASGCSRHSAGNEFHQDNIDMYNCGAGSSQIQEQSPSLVITELLCMTHVFSEPISCCKLDTSPSYRARGIRRGCRNTVSRLPNQDSFPQNSRHQFTYPSCIGFDSCVSKRRYQYQHFDGCLLFKHIYCILDSNCARSHVSWTLLGVFDFLLQVPT